MTSILHLCISLAYLEGNMSPQYCLRQCNCFLNLEGGKGIDKGKGEGRRRNLPHPNQIPGYARDISLCKNG